MALKRIFLSRWHELLAVSKDPSEYNGDSPGGVAAELGISRQAVHKALKRGDLDGWRVVRDDTGELAAIVIHPESVRRYIALRKVRGAA
jgi:predicted secreted protein